MLTWIEANGVWLGWLAVGSVVTFVGSLVLVPVVVARIPADYFTHKHRQHDYPHDPHPWLHRLAIVLKNLIGYVLIMAGFAMLLLPGQGILTILLGVMLIDFPGKYVLEKRLVRRPRVLRTINWMRSKANHPPLEPPEDGD